MSKCALIAVAGVFGVCASSPAQEMQASSESRPVRFTLQQRGPDGVVEVPSAKGRRFSTLNSVWYGPAALTLSDQRRFSFPSAFAWMEAAPADFIPVASLAEAPRVNPARAPLTRDSAGKPVDLLPKLDYAGSEVGVFYGKSTGKYGREVKAGYILSEIVDGNTHISVGMSYQESTGRGPNIIGR